MAATPLLPLLKEYIIFLGMFILLVILLLIISALLRKYFPKNKFPEKIEKITEEISKSI